MPAPRLQQLEVVSPPGARRADLVYDAHAR
jgi:hypothetical protein